jgi:hypothetical protein
VTNVVSTTFVSARYRCEARYGTLGASSKEPPRPESRIEANTLGESRSGRQSQSMPPSRPTSAIVRPSPMAA